MCGDVEMERKRTRISDSLPASTPHCRCSAAHTRMPAAFVQQTIAKMSSVQSAASTPPFCADADKDWPQRVFCEKTIAGSKHDDASGSAQAVRVTLDFVSLDFVSLSTNAIEWVLGRAVTNTDCDKINIVNLELTSTVNQGLARLIISDKAHENGILGFASLELLDPPAFFARFCEMSARCTHWRRATAAAGNIPVCLEQVFKLCDIQPRPGTLNVFDCRGMSHSSGSVASRKRKKIEDAWILEAKQDGADVFGAASKALDIAQSTGGYFEHLRVKRQRV